MSAETVGEALRRLRLQRGLTLRKLGALVHYSHVYIWDVEKGNKEALPELVSRCDLHLGAGGKLVALAAQSRRHDDQMLEELGLHVGSHWTECLDTVTALWQHDAGRRKLLRGALFVPAALAAPVKWWLSSEGSPPTQHGASVDVEPLRQMITTFRRMDNLYGGGEVRPAVVQFLDSQITPILRQNPLEALGATFVSAVAELTQLAGWFAYDSLDHGLAERYFIQALQLARWADDRQLGAEILNGMSHQAIFLHQPRRALHLARAAHKTADKARTPALLAEASVMKARAFALQGLERECVMALADAERQIGSDRTDDPQWMAYFDEAYLAAFFGHCHRALGNGDQAERSALRSLDMDISYLRGRLFNQILLAESYVLKRDIDQACLMGQQALEWAADVSSARAVVFINRLAKDLEPWRSHKAVKQFTERARLVSA